MDPVRLELLLALKQHVDPKGIMAPGVLFTKTQNPIGEIREGTQL